MKGEISEGKGRVWMRMKGGSQNLVGLLIYVFANCVFSLIWNGKLGQLANVGRFVSDGAVVYVCV